MNGVLSNVIRMNESIPSKWFKMLNKNLKCKAEIEKTINKRQWVTKLATLVKNFNVLVKYILTIVTKYWTYGNHSDKTLYKQNIMTHHCAYANYSDNTQYRQTIVTKHCTHANYSDKTLYKQTIVAKHSIYTKYSENKQKFLHSTSCIVRK